MRPARSGKVLCAGRTYCDLVFTGVPKIPVPGEEIFADHFGIHAGGGAFITAAYLAASGVKTALCSALPTGPLGQEVMRQLDQTALDLEYCEPAPEGTEPQVTVAMALSKDRSFLTNRSGPSLPASINTALMDPALVHLHIAELATLADNPGLAQKARARGITVSLDCSWDEALLSNRTTRGLIAGIDIFLPNEKELRTLLDLGQSLPDAAHEISSLAPMMVIKQGAAGATLFCESAVITEPAIRTTLVDATGAGDAFNAGFLAAWLRGSSARDCLVSGNRSGALAVRCAGGASSLNYAQVLTHVV
jgi:sugar/nucleoside kinase (ribokinase family)